MIYVKAKASHKSQSGFSENHEFWKCTLLTWADIFVFGISHGGGFELPCEEKHTVILYFQVPVTSRGV